MLELMNETFTDSMEVIYQEPTFIHRQFSHQSHNSQSNEALIIEQFYQHLAPSSESIDNYRIWRVAKCL
jgi:hypothetical protein